MTIGHSADRSVKGERMLKKRFFAATVLAMVGLLWGGVVGSARLLRGRLWQRGREQIEQYYNYRERCDF